MTPTETAATSRFASKRSSFLVAAGILLSRIAGLIRYRVFAHYFGNSDAADAFKAAFRIPNALANLFGEQVLGDDLLELIYRKPNGRQPGFTKACRRVLMDVRRPLGAREVCVELERYAPAILARHKDPLASVTTVLNRLVDYGEARSLSNDRGRRVWEWISDAEVPADAMASRIPA